MADILIFSFSGWATDYALYLIEAHCLQLHDMHDMITEKYSIQVFHNNIF